MPDKQDPLPSDSVTGKVSAPWEKISGLGDHTGEYDRPALDEGYVYVADSDPDGGPEVLTEQLPLGNDTAEHPASDAILDVSSDLSGEGEYLNHSERRPLAEQNRAAMLDTRGFPLLDDDSFDDEERGSRFPLLIGGVSLLGLVIVGGALALSSLGGSGSEDTADSSTVPLGTVETVAPTPSFVTGSPSVTYTDTQNSPVSGSVEYAPSPAAPAQDVQEGQQTWVQPQPSHAQPQVQQPSQQADDSGQWGQEDSDSRGSGGSGSQEEVEAPSAVQTTQPNVVPELPQNEDPATDQNTDGIDQNQQTEQNNEATE